MNENSRNGLRPPDGKLNAGEYYDVAIYYYGGPQWFTGVPPTTAVTFRCVGYTTPKSTVWHLLNVCPDRPLPPCPITHGNYKKLLLRLIGQELTEATGKPISGLFASPNKMEWPEEGTGTFWRGVPDISAVGHSYNALMTKDYDASCVDVGDRSDIPNPRKEVIPDGEQTPPHGLTSSP